jgi:aminocarboxymuconate-semialdehyde decarboxylase
MATTRRGLLGGLAGIAFVRCASIGEARSEGRPPRREVFINGRRVRAIDVHAHCAVPEAMALMGLKVSPEALAVSQDRVRAMDAQGIDMEALSINPYWYKAERDLAAQIIKLQNEKLAEICAEQPERFVAFGTVALQYPDLAADQLETAVKKLGLRGTLIGGSVNGEELSDAKFHPFWAKAEELRALIFIHPQGTAELVGRLKGNGGLTNVIGNPLETTIALSHLIFEGTLDRFPGLKICAAHGGGYLPSYAARSDAGCTTFPSRCTIALKKKPTEYLRQLYYDSLVFTPEGLHHLIAEVGAGQIVMGTDYPYPWTKTAVDHIWRRPNSAMPSAPQFLARPPRASSASSLDTFWDGSLTRGTSCRGTVEVAGTVFESADHPADGLAEQDLDQALQQAGPEFEIDKKGDPAATRYRGKDPVVVQIAKRPLGIGDVDAPRRV